MVSWIVGERFDKDAPDWVSLLVIVLLFIGLGLEALWGQLMPLLTFVVGMFVGALLGVMAVAVAQDSRT